MDISVLEDLGFSPAEIKIYLALLELGISRAGGVIRKTKLQNSVVHLTLSRMAEKGLVSFVRKGQVKHYEAADPRHIIRLIDEKKARLEALVPQLMAKQHGEERQEAEVFEGMQSFKNLLYKTIEDSEPGDEYIFFAFVTGKELWDAEVYEFYRAFTVERKRREIVTKGIASAERRFKFVRYRGEVSDVLFVNFPTLQNISIFRNRVVMTPWEDKQVSFLITSPQLAESFRTYFYSIWNQYRK